MTNWQARIVCVWLASMTSGGNLALFKWSALSLITVLSQINSFFFTALLIDERRNKSNMRGVWLWLLLPNIVDVTWTVFVMLSAAYFVVYQWSRIIDHFAHWHTADRRPFCESDTRQSSIRATRLVVSRPTDCFASRVDAQRSLPDDCNNTIASRQWFAWLQRTPALTNLKLKLKLKLKPW